ncbi:MAG TPA: hypothetical protein VJ792_09925 [Candidatus Nitrosotalea sp.]|nr:hypothetical protein [Candidatus Nitrosotalea sp.]
MPRNYTYLAIGAVACFLVSAGIYGMLNVHLIQANPEPEKIPDYSAKLDSLSNQMGNMSSEVDSLKSKVSSISSEVDAINNNITSFGSLKTNIADIHEKLSDLQNLNTNMADIKQKLTNMGESTPPSSQGPLLISLDKSVYAPGNTVQIKATGATPLNAVQVQLVDVNGFTVLGQTTWADSTGSVAYGLQLSSSMLPGQYQVKLTSGQLTASQPMTVGSQSSTTFTAQTDKGIYQAGDMVQVTGMAIPASAVTAVMESSAGSTFNSSTTANSDGSYTIVFSTSPTYQGGTWTITVTNLSQTKTITIYLQSSGSSSGSYSFTASTDKSYYQPGDLVQITGMAIPSSTVTAVMTSPSQSTYSSSTTVNSDGSYTIIFSTTSSYQTGSWNVDVSNLGQSKTLYFTLGQSGGSSSQTAFTAATDKPSYQPGDLVQISGTAPAGSTITAVLVSPSGNTYNTSSTANSNGDYVMFFATTGSYPTGNWYAEVTNQGQTKILSFALQTS